MSAPEAGRVAALYDIHGNLPALEAALAAADAAGADAIVVGGDDALGPMPRETLECLLALGSRAQWLRGNCDRLVVEAFDGPPRKARPPAIQAAIDWTAQQLDRSHRDVLAGLPETLTLHVAGMGEVLFCHATPRSDEEMFTAITPAERVRPMLAGVQQPVVVCGHTHMQFDRTIDGVRVLNAGSVGMPFGEAGAHWLLLGPDARLTITAYDRARFEQRVRAGSYPQAAEFLSPYSAEQALAHFERAVGAGA